MKRGLPWAGAVMGLALTLLGCSSDSNPVLAPTAPSVDGGDRGLYQGLDAQGIDTKPAAQDVGGFAVDVAVGRDAVGDIPMGIDAPLPPRIALTILYPTAAAWDGGTPSDGGSAAVIINAGSRFAPKVSVEVESRGGDPTTEVLTSVVARLMAPKTSTPVASVNLNQTQYNVLPESASKTYLFSDTPFDLGKVPSGTYDLVIDATTVGGTTASASVSIYIDGGPAITFLQPADGAYVKGSVIVTAIVSDNRAAVTSVTLAVGQTALPASAVSSSGVQYTATIDFNSFDPPLDGAQIVSVTAVNGNGITSLASRKFTVDNTGPVISGTKPASGDLIGRLLTIEAKVEDAAGVMSGSVVAVLAHGDIHFEVGLVKGTDGTYRQIFDTTQLPEYAIFPSISFRAQDVLGNQSAVGYLVSLDNTPPIVDLDPPASLRLYRNDGICSWPIDPVGPDAVDDGSVVNQLFDIRARIEDEGNKPLSGEADFVLIARTDPAAVKVLILDDTNQPLVVDTSDPPDGLCDDVNPDLIPSVSPQSSKDAQLLDLVSLPVGGAGDFSTEPGASCTATGGSTPKPLCATTYSSLKGQSMIYSLGYAASNSPAIWTIGPVVGDSLQCAGRQFDASNNLKDGWACIAVQAADMLGNKQVSRPIRVCIQAQANSKACSAAATGRTALASIALPASPTGKISFVTSTALLDGAGAAVKAGDNVIFTGLGPIAIAGLPGAHLLAPSDSTGKAFNLTDVAVVVPILTSADPLVPTPRPVGVVLTAGKPVHVVTTADTALDPAFTGKVSIANAGIWPLMTWSVTNIEPTGFDLVDSNVDFSLAAVIPKVPDCTGTVLKQSSGLPPKIDASKPCKAWRSYSPAEAVAIN
jgi:hypothetical protein